MDVGGNLFVVNFREQGTIGRISPGRDRSEMFARLPEGSVGNAIRFAADGRMLIADYKRHNILVIDKGSATPHVHFHSDRFSQPNDLTIGKDGAIYASDPDWKGRSGKIWRIAPKADGTVAGEVMTADRTMGTTNGIDLSPDGATLYVGESNSGEIWSYRIDGSELKSARLVKAFEPNTIDGIRTDIDGRLFVARILKGQIAIVLPNGEVQREIGLKGKEPTNLAFGGPDGKTVFVTQRKGGFVEVFATDRAGREYCLMSGACPGDVGKER